MLGLSNVKRMGLDAVEGIWTRLADLIVEQLGIRPDAVVPSAHFIEDSRID
jgi:hypothetical protein